MSVRLDPIVTDPPPRTVLVQDPARTLPVPGVVPILSEAILPARPAQ